MICKASMVQKWGRVTQGGLMTKKQILFLIWPHFIFCHFVAFFSGLAVSSAFIGPLGAGACYIPVIVAFFYTHGNRNFFDQGYRLILEYLCVPACFLVPGGDRGHSPFGLVQRPISP